MTGFAGSKLVLEVSILEYILTLKLFKSVKFLGALRTYVKAKLKFSHNRLVQAQRVLGN